MDHIPFGQSIYSTPLSGQHAINLQQTLATLALTLEDDSYKGADGKIDVDQLGGLVDVMLFFDTKLSHLDFHADVTDLCQKYEEFHNTSNPAFIKNMQETIRNLGSKQPKIGHNQYIDLISALLLHIKEAIHEN